MQHRTGLPTNLKALPLWKLVRIDPLIIAGAGRTAAGAYGRYQGGGRGGGHGARGRAVGGGRGARGRAVRGGRRRGTPLRGKQGQDRGRNSARDQEKTGELKATDAYRSYA